MRDSRRTRLILVLLLLTSFVLITLDFRGGVTSPVTAMRSFGATVFGPVERAAAAVAEPINNTVHALVNAGSSQRRLEALQRENARLRSQLRSNQLTGHRNAELEQLLSLAGRGRYRIVPAEVVAMRGALGYEHTATIDVGRRDGVRTNMTVVCAEGLVGRVVHTGERSSTVLLAIDGSSHVGARMESTGEIGSVNGNGRGSLRLELLDSQAPLKRGDRLVTFGSQGGTPYVPGVPIGTVVSAQQQPASLLQHARVRPFVDFSRLDLVGVVVKPPPEDPRDSLLPPRPTNTPSSGPRDGSGDEPGSESNPSSSPAEDPSTPETAAKE